MQCYPVGKAIIHLKKWPWGGADAGRCLVEHNHHQTCFRPSLDNSVWFVQLHRRSGAMMVVLVIIRTVCTIPYTQFNTEQATRNNPTPNHQRFPPPSPHPTLPHQLPHHPHPQYHRHYPIAVSTSHFHLFTFSSSPSLISLITH